LFGGASCHDLHLGDLAALEFGTGIPV